MKNKVGPPVEGDDFIGREKELEFAFDLLNDGNSLILAAPRRIGKTSFAKKEIQMAKNKGWRTLEINLEGINSEIKFIRSFVVELEKITKWKSVSNLFKNKINHLLEQIDLSIEVDGYKANISINNKRKALFDKLEELLDHSKDTLIFIDELGVLLNTYREDKEIGIDRAENLLNWFRSLRQKSKTKIRWIFCSSIGIRNFANQHNISYTINDIEPYHLKTFDRKTASELIQKLAISKKLNFSKELIESILNKLDWFLPYFIQVLFKEIHKQHHENEIPLDHNIVDLAYEKLIKMQYLDTWIERLKYYKLEYKARKILKFICKNPNGESRTNLVSIIHNQDNDIEETEHEVANILKMLENDGYLFQNTEYRFVFRSPFLRDYWYHKFVK